MRKKGKFLRTGKLLRYTKDDTMAKLCGGRSGSWSAISFGRE